MARKKPVSRGRGLNARQRPGSSEECERHFRDLVEHSLTGVSIIQDGRVVYRNPEQQRMFGPLPEDGSPALYDHIHPEDVPRVRELYEGLTSGRVKHPAMVARFFPGASPDNTSGMRWIHGRASLIEHEGREAILLNMMDVTTARELENVLTMQDRMTSLGHLAAGIAHEIRNPLSGITIYLHSLRKILSRGTDSEEALEIIEKMLDSSRRIDAVIRRVMDFSRPGAPKLASVDIRRPVTEALSLSSVTLRKSEIRLDTGIPGEAIPCCADPQLIEQVMLNLVTNAVEALKGSPPPKILRVTMSTKMGCVRIRVGDSGPGVPRANRQRIFEPFFTTRAGNTGIGLSLSHRIITDHGGRLLVGTSRLGGAEFTILLPVRKEAPPA